ncbi:marvel domain-containing protein [Massariosphaeria phaeospora]|uniref:Marvel domain-containing protein n=1 Tax=Massariosphaeria phaeospora TaxID=100035 RepID=A0A7C8I4J4_9PLEO|nr:marvel domain-containing protein [Massariosphaeria phaeospora]
MPSPVVNFALRGAQALFSIVVIALSVTLIKGQVYKKDQPATFGFSVFVGAISLLGALLGIAAHWLDVLQSIIGVAIDVLILIINLAGGVLIAVKLKGIDCMSEDVLERLKMKNNSLLNGGCYEEKNQVYCRNTVILRGEVLNSRCKENQANSAFMFLTLIVLLAAATVTFLNMKHTVKLGRR